MIHALRTIALGLGIAVFMSAAAFAQSYNRGQPRVQLFVAEGANQNTAATVNIVAVLDRSAVTYMPRTAPEWFGNRRAHLQVFGNGVAVTEYQIVSNSGLLELPLPRSSGRAVALFAYADYLSPEGQALIRLPVRGCSRLVFEEKTISFSECR